MVVEYLNLRDQVYYANHISSLISHLPHASQTSFGFWFGVIVLALFFFTMIWFILCVVQLIMGTAGAEYEDDDDDFEEVQPLFTGFRYSLLSSVDSPAIQRRVSVRYTAADETNPEYVHSFLDRISEQEEPSTSSEAPPAQPSTSQASPSRSIRSSRSQTKSELSEKSANTLSAAQSISTDDSEPVDASLLSATGEPVRRRRSIGKRESSRSTSRGHISKQ